MSFEQLSENVILYQEDISTNVILKNISIGWELNIWWNVKFKVISGLTPTSWSG